MVMAWVMFGLGFGFCQSDECILVTNRRFERAHSTDLGVKTKSELVVFSLVFWNVFDISSPVIDSKQAMDTHIMLDFDLF